MHDNATVAVIPLKAFAATKSRLSDVLSGDERGDLAALLFAGVVDSCATATAVDEVVVVAGDPVGVLLGERAGARTLLEREPGLPGALRLADAELGRMAAAASIVVVADLPLVTAADLDRVCSAVPEGPCVVVAPTGDGGTGALFRRPATVIPTAFGPASAAAHLELGRRAGVRTVELTLPNLALDLDTPEQLAQLRSAGLLQRVDPA